MICFYGAQYVQGFYDNYQQTNHWLKDSKSSHKEKGSSEYYPKQNRPIRESLHTQLFQNMFDQIYDFSELNDVDHVSISIDNVDDPILNQIISHIDELFDCGNEKSYAVKAKHKETGEVHTKSLITKGAGIPELNKPRELFDITIVDLDKFEALSVLPDVLSNSLVHFFYNASEGQILDSLNACSSIENHHLYEIFFCNPSKSMSDILYAHPDTKV